MNKIYRNVCFNPQHRRRNEMSTPVTGTTSPWFIICKSPKGPIPHYDKLYNVALEILKPEQKDCVKEDTTWKIRVKDYDSIWEPLRKLLKHHNYLHEAKFRVEVYSIPDSNDVALQKQVIKIGLRPPTSDNLKTCEEVYREQYLPDHSLFSTRLIHTLATVVGVSGAVYGIFHGQWISIPLGIGLIYEAGFHSHLFIEKNIPSSTKYPLQSVYSDLRVTFQMLTNWLTGGMDADLARADIYDVEKVKFD
jgi:hypothetical protein